MKHNHKFHVINNNQNDDIDNQKKDDIVDYNNHYDNHNDDTKKLFNCTKCNKKFSHYQK
jgi:hypothetical protein